MPRNKIDFDTVRKIALALPDVADSTTYGTQALKVKGKLLACIPINRTVEPGSVAMSIDFERREELLKSKPETFYVTDHYVRHPVVLIRMSRIGLDELRDLIGIAWQFASTPPRRPKRK